MHPLPSRATRAAFLFLLALAFFSGCTSSPTPHSTPISYRAKACTFSIMNRGGELIVLYEKAYIVGEVAGKDEWWLDLPTREKYRDVEGQARAVNWPKARVLRAGEARVVGALACRCPESLW
jgi:hypothetical protein